ncbi:MAG: CRISPR-associated helicase Cas3' [Verrucomicrobiales bacterium]|nr:CRISPR-associated helicase Cas3' [Verrucomicrobiales bacterium]
MTYYAHTAEGPDGKPDVDQAKWQLLRDHLKQVARLAREFAEPLGLGDEAELAGLLHDLGKYSARFQARLQNPSIHGINHWAAGATQAASQAAVAFAIDGHHTGIPAKDGSGLRQTIAKMLEDRERDEFCRCPEPVSELVRRCETDGIRVPTIAKRKAGHLFAEALRTRMIFSCLVDGDFLDTEEHFSPGTRKLRQVVELQPQRALPLLLDRLASLSQDGDLNRRRRQLLADCLSAAARSPGLFTLTAPTGSGKTLSSLAFALRHIEHHNAQLPEGDPRRFRRIIVVIPFTSIIEQTAQVYRGLFENSLGGEYVLEHHSAVAPREQCEDCGHDGEEARLRRARLAAENWASPLVITTNVQFFESLFSNRPSDCRKLHNIARSVVVFDEVQTLPPNLVPSLLSGVKLLTQDYGVTALFMTATQPAFAAAGDAVLGGWNPATIGTDETGLAEALKRTRIELPPRDQIMSWEQLADRLATESQVLCVVNTTDDARLLFEMLHDRCSSGLFHLSSRLCPQHRREKLQAIRQHLRDGLPCRLISTQLIEAGVDVDFPIAFRALGPLDSIIQTAGRCNREGRASEPRPVIVFRPEHMKTPPGAYRIATAKTVEFLDRHPAAADHLHLPEFYAAYFRELYGLLGPESAKHDPVFAACEALDFPKAAEECRLIANDTRAVLVKWGRGQELANRLAHQGHLTAAECREVQRFSVNLYLTEFNSANSKGYLYKPAKDWDFWAWNSDYDENLGLGHVGIDDYCL